MLLTKRNIHYIIFSHLCTVITIIDFRHISKVIFTANMTLVLHGDEEEKPGH